MSILPLRQRVVLVTGAASGIGAAVARAFSAQGYEVALTDKDTEGLKNIAATLPEEHTLVLSMDVTQEKQVEAAVTQVVQRWETLDVIVTCAGILHHTVIEEWLSTWMQAELMVNVLGTFHCVRAVVPIMRRQGHGNIIMISSLAGKLGVPLLSGYSAAKWAVSGLAASLRSELYGTGIHITTIYPSEVDTALASHAPRAATTPEVAALIDAYVTLGRRRLIPIERVVAAILSTVQRPRREIIVTGGGMMTRLGLFVGRLYPGITEYILGKRCLQLRGTTGYDLSIKQDREKTKV